MSAILVTFPGKLGDLLWALPTVREISRLAGAPVDLMLGDYCAPLVELLQEGCKDYLAAVVVNPEWKVQMTAPVSPRVPPSFVGASRYARVHHARVYHLGYDGWPGEPLPFEIYHTATGQGLSRVLSMRPWIYVPPERRLTASPTVYLGFTDEWFELKLGLVHILDRELDDVAGLRAIMPPTSRWETAPWPAGGMARREPEGWDWLTTARALAACDLYVGDLSAQWVLANAMGIPCVVVEPSEPRHNPIFWWDGPTLTDGKPRNVMVRGGDGRPTFDARAVVKEVKEALERLGRRG